MRREVAKKWMRWISNRTGKHTPSLCFCQSRKNLPQQRLSAKRLPAYFFTKSDPIHSEHSILACNWSLTGHLLATARRHPSSQIDIRTAMVNSPWTRWMVISCAAPTGIAWVQQRKPRVRPRVHNLWKLTATHTRQSVLFEPSFFFATDGRPDSVRIIERLWQWQATPELSASSDPCCG